MSGVIGGRINETKLYPTDMQVNTITDVPEGKQCITKTSPPGQRCLQPLYTDFVLSPQSPRLPYEYEEEYAAYPHNSDGYSVAPPPDYADAPAPSAPGRVSFPIDATICTPLACSTDGRVLVYGEPCDPGAP
jgi:hypothetical protein